MLSLVLTLIESGEAKLIRSPVHDLENSRNPFSLRRQWVQKCLLIAAETISLGETIKTRALVLEKNGGQVLNALHLAAAEAAGADRVLTCVDHLMRRYSGKMVVQSPLIFITNLS